MPDTPLISVIVPVYNVAPYLPRCLDSICNQTYQNLEIILVDDGSTDNSLEICNRYAAKDKRIVIIILKKNGGLSTARNTGMDHMHGEFFTFIDSDDWVTPDYCQVLFDLINQSGADFSWGGFTTVTAEGQFSSAQQAFSLVAPKKQILSLDEIIRLSSYMEEHAACVKLFRATKYQKYRFNGFYTHSEDFDFFIKLLKNSPKVVYTPTSLYFYSQQNPFSISRSVQIDAQQKILSQHAELLDFCKQHQLTNAFEIATMVADATRCVLIARVILLNLKTPSSFLTEQQHYILQHKKQIWHNTKMELPGKLFTLFFAYCPRIFTFCCRLPVINPWLLAHFNQRINRSLLN